MEYQVTVKCLATGPAQHARAVEKFVHGVAQELLVGLATETSDEGVIEITGASVARVAAASPLSLQLPAQPPRLLWVEYYRLWDDHTWDTDFLSIPEYVPDAEIDAAVREEVKKITWEDETPWEVGVYHFNRDDLEEEDLQIEPPQ